MYSASNLLFVCFFNEFRLITKTKKGAKFAIYLTINKQISLLVGHLGLEPRTFRL